MSHFTQVKSLRPGRSVFNLSYQRTFDFDVGKLVPVCCEEMVPGDTFKVGNEIVINSQPLLSSVYAALNATVHYFFVPTRLLFDGWEDFITGGIDGNDVTVLPRFNPSDTSDSLRAACEGPYSLYDYFGFPVVMNDDNVYSYPGRGTVLSSSSYFYRPLAFPWRAYNLIWNEFYRDETLQQEVDLDQPFVLNRNWSKDYFTSALPFQQRGTTPALPISGDLDVVFSSKGNTLIDLTSRNVASDYSVPVGQIFSIDNSDNRAAAYINEVGPRPLGDAGRIGAVQLTGNHVNTVTSGKVDLGDAITFDVSDLRMAFQVQKFMERAARGGVRYTEFLTSFFGVSPTDARLQRPEYIGGSKSPILINQIKQTSGGVPSESSPTGMIRGNGITADKNYICSYTASEFGYLVGILSVLPQPQYQQGVDRKWLRKSKTDFYFPMFAHLSEQEVTEEEIFAFAGDGDNGLSGDAKIWNGKIFGYQAPYNEMRSNKNIVAGSLRDSLSYWHLGRIFDTAPALNSDFISCDHTRDHLDRIFAVQSVPGLICNFANIITAIRPLPKYGEPGLIDHS